MPEELKTLKDLKEDLICELISEFDIHERFAKEIVELIFEKQEAEAIKWVKEAKKYDIKSYGAEAWETLFKEFHNITEEDLNAK